jgi:uncharacterized protein (TIGR00369 family)
MTEFEPGERYFDGQSREPRDFDGPTFWKTLDYHRTVWEPGHQVIEWEATEHHSFPSSTGYIVHGGMVATVLDTAMGGACATLMDRRHSFLTADLRVEFLRATRPGLLRAEGHVVRRARRVVFCSADLYDTEGSHLATARCTQIVLPAEQGDREEIGG